MRMIVKVIVNNNEHEVREIYSKYSLYNMLKEFNLKNLSLMEHDEFYISNVKSVTINNSCCLNIDELLFTNTDDIVCGIYVMNKIRTITEYDLDKVILLEIEV